MRITQALRPCCGRGSGRRDGSKRVLSVWVGYSFGRQVVELLPVGCRVILLSPIVVGDWPRRRRGL